MLLAASLTVFAVALPLLHTPTCTTIRLPATTALGRVTALLVAIARALAFCTKAGAAATAIPGSPSVSMTSATTALIATRPRRARRSLINRPR
ncbi:hypothetical protein CLV40_1148 [Actinokineospora auranticolor]|uniref:Uncharacterized protein n=1 Tax=Actinokineospora auranticolor TaxID=155976 RepID=A0A2S6GJM8_9PSEU|nr:hypothetical protein CLV40_1148 [Actinokineospora auranticolor]